MDSEIKITDNSKQALEELEEAIELALEECGLVAERYAKKLCKVNTGNLRNSITHAVDMEERVCYVGTNTEYAPYVELGTGEYVPGGSPPWVYMDDQGNFHRTSGNPASPFIKPAVADHGSEYQDIITEAMQG